MTHPHALHLLAEATSPPPQTRWNTATWLSFAEEVTLVEVSGEVLSDDDYEALLQAAIADPFQAVSNYPAIASAKTKDDLRDETAVLLLALLAQLQEKRITFTRWQEEHARILVAGHLRGLEIGLGRVPTPADIGRVEDQIREQLYSGTGVDGKSFGLSELAADVLSGDMSLARLQQRSTNYGASSFISVQLGEQIIASATKTHMIRRLGIAEHCPDCPRYANRLALIGELPVPGQQCRCRHNCKCTVRYLTLAEAIAEGLG